MAASIWLLKISFMLFYIVPLFCNDGVTSNYVRKSEPSIDMPIHHFPPPPGYNAPEQVHITQGDKVGRSVIISWVTPVERHPNVVTYWEAAANGDDKHENYIKHQAHSTITSYRYYNYTSGYIHHATIKRLKFNTRYFYELGKHESKRRFSFTTPPKVGPDVPYTFGIIGDLGQTYASNQTLEHYMSNPNGQAVLFVGDISYADHYPFHDNVRWDTWGRFAEKCTAYQPWIWTAGNHEIAYICSYSTPQPSYSAYREASFGHAILEIKNRTHAYYTWHRNQDNEAAVPADSTWFYNRIWYPAEEYSFS